MATAMAIAVVTAVIVGCGGSSDQPDALEQFGCPADNGTIGTSELTPAQDCVRTALGIGIDTSNPYSVVPSMSLDGCDVAVILTSPDAIKLYGSDSIAVDPTGTIGLKTTSGCVPTLEDSLASALKKPPAN